jgi:hypothetical protein
MKVYILYFFNGQDYYVKEDEIQGLYSSMEKAVAEARRLQAIGEHLNHWNKKPAPLLGYDEADWSETDGWHYHIAEYPIDYVPAEAVIQNHITEPVTTENHAVVAPMVALTPKSLGDA